MKAALSIAFEDLRGKAGTVVVSKSRSGLVLKNRVNGKQPDTAAQRAIRNDLSRAAATYKNLTTAQVTAWRAYANTQSRTNPISGETYFQTANTAFVGLAVKFLQVTPGGTVPVAPPTTAFTGDTITVTALASSGKVTFTASGANASGVTTELLLEPLKSPNRKPSGKGYRSKAYFAFASGTLSHDVTVPTGYYAAAYRFVKTATGQMTELIPLGTQGVTFAVATPSSKPKAA